MKMSRQGNNEHSIINFCFIQLQK